MQYPIKIKEVFTSDVYTGTSVFSSINTFINTKFPLPCKRIILVDENTREHCLTFLLDFTPALQNAEIIEIKSGENSKSIETAIYIWKKLDELKADRDALMINLGGGVISDLGGFAASVYKRGIGYINVPTTLMGMADAAIGGKTGVNMLHVKNQIGNFELPIAVFIFSGFLHTLNRTQILNGIAEIIKYGLITDYGLWKKMQKMDIGKLLNEPFRDSTWEELIKKTVRIKSDLVEKDYRDFQHRKILNFGHTVGHAFETWFLQKQQTEIAHGHAVALGIICESYLSHLKLGLTNEDLEAIIRVIENNYELLKIPTGAYDDFIELMEKDKKNVQGKFLFTLLKEPGKAVINQDCKRKMILDCLEYYNKLTS